MTVLARGPRALARPFAHLLTFLTLAALVAPAGATMRLVPPAGDEATRLLSSGASGASFEIDVPEPRFVAVKAPNAEYRRFDLDGFQWSGKPGEPMLPARGVWIAVPQGATVTLDAEGTGERAYEGIRLLPQQELPRATSDEVTSTIVPSGALARPIVEDPASYARRGYGDSPAATLDAVVDMRAQRMAHVVVRPAAYDPSSGRVRVWSKVRVRLTFSGAANAAPGGFDSALAPASGDDAFEPIYRSLVLNYDSGRAWRRDLAEGSLARLGRQPNTQSTTAGGFGVREDFSSTPNWVRIDVSSKGLYRFDAGDFAATGVNIAAVDPRTIRIFARPGGPLLDENAAPNGWLNELAINVVGEGDGVFDPSDYVLFTALGPSGWRDEYTNSPQDSGWINYPYDTKTSLYLTWGGGFSSPPKRWATRDVSPVDPAAWPAPFYAARNHFEFDTSYQPDLQEGAQFHALTGVFWEKWIWINVTQASPGVPFNFNLPGAVTTEPGRLFLRLWGNSREPNGTSGLRDHYTNVSINDVAQAERAYYGTLRQDYDTTFAVRETGNRLVVSCRPILDNAFRPPRYRTDVVAMFWYDAYYKRRFQPIGNILDFASADTTGNVAYGIGPFSQTTGLFLLDTTDPFGTVQLTGLVERDTTGGKAVYLADDATAKRRYYAVTSSGIKRPDATARMFIDDLRSTANGADYVVITYDGFTSMAQKLVARRSAHLPGVANPRARMVKASDIYAWYSSGRTDPIAIRNFIYDAVKVVGWSPSPSYVCLLGDASYDFKNVYRLAPAGQPACLLPAYVNGYQTRQFMTDDWLVDLDLGVKEPWPGGPPPGFPDSTLYDVPDLVVGRIPASNAEDARFLVEDKILKYETSPTFGEWRATGLLVADDITQGRPRPDGSTDDPLGTQHMAETESLSTTYVAPIVDQEKVYLIRYPYGSGDEKPAANQDIKRALNDGQLFWNFIGHGSPFKMADENAFINSDVGALTNLDKLTVLVAASCDLGKFDDPVVIGLGENLLKARAGGVVGCISASDIAFAFSNVELAKSLYLSMMRESANGFDVPIGRALLDAKYRRELLSANDLKYDYMGDPGQALGLPEQDVRLTLTDAETSAPADSLRRGRKIHVTGYVTTSHDPAVTDVNTAFNGVASLLVTDSPSLDTLVVNPFENFAYRYNPGVIFHGDLPVTNGRFDATFIVPLEALRGDRAKVRIYANDGQVDAAGVNVMNVVQGTAASVDTTGPTIALAFTSGQTTVAPTARLRVVVADENGVLLTGHTIPNSLSLLIDGVTRYDLTQDFRYDSGSYQRGTVEFVLPGLDPGPHQITVSAADNYAQGVLAKKNRASATIDFRVASGEGFALGNVYNFPNPFVPEAGTSFVVSDLTEAANVQVKIYTVSGSLVRILDATGGPGQVQIPWDGRDGQGDPIANGAYLYLVQAENQSTGQVVRYRGRAAVLR